MITFYKMNILYKIGFFVYLYLYYFYSFIYLFIIYNGEKERKKRT